MRFVEVFQIHKRVAVLDNGEAIPITNFFDVDGDERFYEGNIPLAVTAFTAGPDSNGKSHSVKIDAFTGVPTQ